MKKANEGDKELTEKYLKASKGIGKLLKNRR